MCKGAFETLPYDTDSVDYLQDCLVSSLIYTDII